jgi:hypothetical protein
VEFIAFLMEPLNEYTYIRGLPQTSHHMRQVVIVEVVAARVHVSLHVAQSALRVQRLRGFLYEIKENPRFPDWM